LSGAAGTFDCALLLSTKYLHTPDTECEPGYAPNAVSIGCHHALYAVQLDAPTR